MIQRVLASKGVAAYLLALATGITLYVHGDAISLPGESFGLAHKRHSAALCAMRKNCAVKTLSFQEYVDVRSPQETTPKHPRVQSTL